MKRIKTIVAWMIVFTSNLFDTPVDVGHGLYHFVRCEIIFKDWQWVDYESEIGGEIYTFKHCSKCRYRKRVAIAYI